MKVKTEELSGCLLDYAVALCRHLKNNRHKPPVYNLATGKVYESMGRMSIDYVYAPSRIWGQCGPIIERDKIRIMPCPRGWSACEYKFGAPYIEGETPIIAAMRCYVVMVIGECIDIPDDLYNLHIGK